MTDAHRALIANRFPQLGDIRSFQRIDGGWTCDTYEVNGEWIVQLPRNDRSRQSLEAQLELLPELGRELSAQIPLPELVSREPLIMGYRKLDGSPANDDLGIWPERLGRFLYDLHMVPPEFVGLRAVSPESVREGLRAEWDRLREVGAGLLAAEELQTADGVFGGYLEDERNWRFAPCLTHGDLGPEHVLVSPSGDLIGVIDWEEAVVWDPAGDFAWWLNARPDVGERALAAYGGSPDERFRERARVLFALMPWHEVEYGVSDGGPDFVASGLVGVRERLALIAQ
jgi:aminoglycoside phosphotransferase (APT) family kinase protein